MKNTLPPHLKIWPQSAILGFCWEFPYFPPLASQVPRKWTPRECSLSRSRLPPSPYRRPSARPAPDRNSQQRSMSADYCSRGSSGCRAVRPSLPRRLPRTCRWCRRSLKEGFFVWKQVLNSVSLKSRFNQSAKLYYTSCFDGVWIKIEKFGSIQTNL